MNRDSAFIAPILLAVLNKDTVISSNLLRLLRNNSKVVVVDFAENISQFLKLMS